MRIKMIEVYYLKREHFDLMLNTDKITLENLNETHVKMPELPDIFDNNPDKVFASLNSDYYYATPEIQKFIRENQTHTSMSVGDIVKMNRKIYLCEDIGWRELNYIYYDPEEESESGGVTTMEIVGDVETNIEKIEKLVQSKGFTEVLDKLKVMYEEIGVMKGGSILLKEEDMRTEGVEGSIEDVADLFNRVFVKLQKPFFARIIETTTATERVFSNSLQIYRISEKFEIERYTEKKKKDLFICPKCNANLLEVGITEVVIGAVVNTNIFFREVNGRKLAYIEESSIEDIHNDKYVLCLSCTAELHDRTADEIIEAYESCDEKEEE